FVGTRRRGMRLLRRRNVLREEKAATGYTLSGGISVRVKWFARFVIPNRISKKTNVDCGRLDAMRYTKEG
ncbi:hypothetical protein, partial [Rubritalea tangerina]|uniref:hypothetical protein n=1 Tax=Rubritalea tangerina TaxID=430798 RepID=UPI0036123EB9